METNNLTESMGLSILHTYWGMCLKARDISRWQLDEAYRMGSDDARPYAGLVKRGIYASKGGGKNSPKFTEEGLAYAAQTYGEACSAMLVTMATDKTFEANLRAILDPLKLERMSYRNMKQNGVKIVWHNEDFETTFTHNELPFVRVHYMATFRIDGENDRKFAEALEETRQLATHFDKLLKLAVDKAKKSL